MRRRKSFSRWTAVPAEMALIERWAGIRVLVVGEAMLDTYLPGSASRLSPEAPGGAANTAANVVALGGRATFVSVVGDDPEGRAIADRLAERGVDVGSLLVSRSRRALQKQRLLA